MCKVIYSLMLYWYLIYQDQYEMKKCFDMKRNINYGIKKSNGEYIKEL